MESKRNLVSLVAFFALVLLLTSFASAVKATISDVEVAGVNNANNIASFAGQTIPVRVVFSADANMSDVRVKVWISGDRDYAVSSDRFDVIADNVYSKLMSVQIPSSIDPEEELKLEVSIESKNDGEVGSREVALAAQRESYTLEVLDVIMEPKVKAGESLAIDLVLKNRGRHLAEDTFVKATIPALGIERRVFFGDLSPVDQTDPDKEDSVERKMYLNIPASTPAGIYEIQFEAYNADSSETVMKKIAVVGASGDSRIISAAQTKTFAVGERTSYVLTLVNTGAQVRVYDISFEAPDGLDVSADETIVAVSSGSSKAVKVDASASKAGKYTFVVNVESDGELVKKESYVAQVEGKRIGTANTTVVLTIVLAIIFIVLLVVLVVLLTRKPQKSEELGESYY